MTSASQAISLNALAKSFGGLQVVKDVSLTIEAGQVAVLVGPSGCGKTTTLRMIAGLERETSGDIFIGARRVNDLSPRERDIAMVFQSFALYPHMTVRENITLNLSIRKTSVREIDRRLSEVAELLEIGPLLARYPAQLSGGQKQRVAVGRAIVRRPSALLMDEPLSNLDTRLRTSMRAELQRLVRSLGLTTVYVTHDHTEAMTMGDLVVVMEGGVVQQVGSPDAVYGNPSNLFVAELLGACGINVLPGEALPNGHLVVGNGIPMALNPYPQVVGPVLIGFRPEFTSIVAAAADSAFVGSVELMERHGAASMLHLTTAAGPVRVAGSRQLKLSENKIVGLTVSPGDLLLFDVVTRARIA